MKAFGSHDLFLAELRRRGGSISTIEMQRAIGGDPTEIAATLRDMQRSGLVIGDPEEKTWHLLAPIHRVEQSASAKPAAKPRKPRKAKPRAAPETEHQRLARVVEERAAAARYSFKHGLRENETDRSNLIMARHDLARRIALDLGHNPLKQGISYECPRCGASGTFDVEPIGAIFTDRCHP